MVLLLSFQVGFCFTLCFFYGADCELDAVHQCLSNAGPWHTSILGDIIRCAERNDPVSLNWFKIKKVNIPLRRDCATKSMYVYFTPSTPPKKLVFYEISFVCI